MSYFIVLLFMLILGVDVAYLFKRGFGQTAAISNFMLIFVLYLGGLFADMRSAAYVFLAFVVLLTAFVGYKVIRTRGIGEIKAVVKNPALYVYAALGLTFGIVFFTYNTVVNDIGDELTHWSLVVKNMWAYDNFGNLDGATTMFNQYVPATGIFMYAFQIFEPSFRNGMLYSAMNLLIISLVLPVIDMFDKKLSIPCVVCFIAAILECFLFNVQLFHSTLVDVPIAMMAAYIFLAYKQDKGRADGFTIVNIALACCGLTLTKTSGLALVAFALIFIVIDAFTLGKERTKEFFKEKRNFVFVLLPVVLIAFAKLSWSWYIDFYGVGEGWNASEMTVSNILLWLKSPNAYQSTVTSLFLKTFFLGNGYGVQIPCILGILLTVGACFLLWYGTKNKKFAVAHGVLTVVIVAGYAIYLMLLYLFSFAYKEGLGLASYCRYMSSVWLTVALIYIYHIVDIFAVPLSEKGVLPKSISAKIKPLAYPIFAAALCVFTAAASIGGALTCQKKVSNGEAEYAAWAQALGTLGVGDSVYIVINDAGGAGLHVRQYTSMRFMATPVQTSGYLEGGNYADGRDADTWWTGNPFSMELSVDGLSAEMSKYTHVYLHDVWDEFEEKYGELFESPIEDDTLYEVSYDGEALKLVRAEE